MAESFYAAREAAMTPDLIQARDEAAARHNAAIDAAGEDLRMARMQAVLHNLGERAVSSLIDAEVEPDFRVVPPVELPQRQQFSWKKPFRRLDPPKPGKPPGMGEREPMHEGWFVSSREVRVDSGTAAYTRLREVTFLDKATGGLMVVTKHEDRAIGSKVNVGDDGLLPRPVTNEETGTTRPMRIVEAPHRPAYAKSIGQAALPKHQSDYQGPKDETGKMKQVTFDARIGVHRYDELPANAGLTPQTEQARHAAMRAMLANKGVHKI